MLTAVLGGGRDPDEQVRLVPWGDERVPARPADPPWPGQVPAPAPATVLADPVPVEVLAADGGPVGVTGRYAVTAEPARFAAPGRPATALLAWAGPWPVDERWWDPAAARRRARFQLLGADGDRLAGRPGGRPLVGRRGVRLMGWSNPPMPWSELERRLSGRRPERAAVPGRRRRQPGLVPAPGGVRAAALPGPTGSRPEPVDPDPVPYAELHCHSNFSFLDGASHPEELAEEAARLGLTALALTDHDGFYGVVRFAEAAKELQAAHHLRRRAVARPGRPAERRGRPGGRAPAGAGPRPGRVRAGSAR